VRAFAPVRSSSLKASVCRDSRTPGIRDLVILWGVEFQDGAPPYLLAVEHAYDSRQSMQAARASSAADVMRAKFDEVMPLFEGTIRHVNYEVGFKGG
jgi:hypothetical protein